MARLPRFVLPDGTYHLIARGVNSCAIVRDDRDRLRWLALLAEVVRRWRWDVYAFCLMNTHYHLVADASRAAFSDGMHRLNGLHAERFNRRHVRPDTSSATDSVSVPIEHEEHLAHACRYVIENPVRAGLTSELGEWRWAASRFGYEE